MKTKKKHEFVSTHRHGNSELWIKYGNDYSSVFAVVPSKQFTKEVEAALIVSFYKGMMFATNQIREGITVPFEVK